MHEDLNRVAILLEDLVQPPTAGIPVVQVPLPGPHIDGSFVDLGDVGVRYGAQDRLRCQGGCCRTEWAQGATGRAPGRNDGPDCESGSG